MPKRYSSEDLNDDSSPERLPKRDKPSKEDYEEIRNYSSKIPKFSTTIYITEFVLHNASKYPEERLMDVFDELIDRAYENVRQTTGREVQLFSMLIFGEGLDTPIAIPARTREQNNSNLILNEIDILEISDKKFNLLDNPMKVIITCIYAPQGHGKLDIIKHMGVNEKARIRIQNKDRYCLFYALELARIYHDQNIIGELKKAKKHIPSDLYTHNRFQRLKNNLSKQRDLAMELMKNAGISQYEKSYGIEHLRIVQKYYHKRYGFGNYRIVLFEQSPILKPIWKSQHYAKYQIVLFLEDEHFDFLTNISSYFVLNRSIYCIDCEKTYDKSQFHRLKCISRCQFCSRMGKGQCNPEEGGEKYCKECNRIFGSRYCYETHLTRMCKLFKRCHKECKRIYRVQKDEHICGETRCKLCQIYHNPKRGCMIQPVERENKQARILVYDFEATQDLEIVDGINEHRVNYCSARWTCTECADNGEQDDCEICKPLGIDKDEQFERHVCWSAADGEDPLREFVQWVLNSWNYKYPTYVYAHYGSRYDHHFVMQRLYRHKLRPKMVMSGCKIYQMRVKLPKKSNIVFRDSYLLMNVKLANLKKTFSLKCDNKLYFPHLFNKSENYEVKLKSLPNKKHYCPGSMMSKERKEFDEWYAKNKNTSFYLPNKLAEYCQNDTEILLEALLKMREILKGITNGFDVLLGANTIASVCMNIFRSMFLKPGTIAITPERGYEREDRASAKAIRYMEWRAKKDGIRIKHSGNCREMKFGKYKLDGYISEENRCIEFLGCYYHGHLDHLSPKDRGPNGKSFLENYESTMERIRELRKSLSNVEIVWECDVDEELKKDKEMREFFKDVNGGLNPETLTMGEELVIVLDMISMIKEAILISGPLALHSVSTNKKVISYYDIISLYPSVNYYTEYPIGIPEIIYPEKTTRVNWTKPKHIRNPKDKKIIRGLLKVHIIPPKRLYLPVLPLRLPSDQRLLFTNCSACARIFEKKNTRIDWKCPHNEKERSFTSTVTSIELAEALRQGYRVDKFYRAWHYKEWDKDLFKQYVRLFMKLKVESSDFPENIKTKEEKEAWAKEYLEKLGVKIDLKNVQFNAGLRHISKLCLNSLWGKFSQRNSLSKTAIITEPSEYYDYLFNPKYEVTMVMPVSKNVMRIIYKDREDFVQENKCSNIVLSLWTTSAARLALYHFMKKAYNTKGCRILYTDTDSIIVEHDADNNPIDEGEFLGDMTKEHAGMRIIEYVAGGAKAYGLKLLPSYKDIKTAKKEDFIYVLKLRGITLDSNNCKKFQYKNFRRMVLNFGDESEHNFSYTKFGPNRSSRIIASKMNKRYMCVNQKNIIAKDLTTYPFGYL